MDKDKLIETLISSKDNEYNWNLYFSKSIEEIAIHILHIKSGLRMINILLNMQKH